jgi:segregation and condensation protein A
MRRNTSAMPVSAKPHIALEAYTGPLDLLLQLIEQHQLDITAIALAQVADQYMAAVNALEQPSPDMLAEFLVIGARLLVIKTRALLPKPPAELAPNEEDAGEQLARQLHEYRRFKQAAAQLRAWEAEGRRTYTRSAPPPVPSAPALEPAPLDIDLLDLVALVQRRLRLLQAEAVEAVPMPVPKIITIADVRQRIHTMLGAQAWVSFEDLLSFSLTRNEVIVTLWTVLELFKRQGIVFDQQHLFGAVMIGRGPMVEEVLGANDERPAANRD